ncbi:MAG: menaquinone reductase molybdopterin-binding-like subunit QrcB [Desulfovibrio sp.]
MGIDRRAFLQFGAGATTGIMFTPVVWKFLDDASIWTQNWSWIPRLNKGAATKQAALSKMCPSGCAATVAKTGKLAYLAEGNVENPLNKGGICPLCASAVQMAYSPSRVKGPMVKDGSGYAPISWDEARKMVAEKIGVQKGKDGKIAVLSGDQSGTGNEVFSAFLNAMGSSAYYMMPGDCQTAGRTWTEIMKGSGQVGYDLEGADYVFLLGADALDSWGPTVRNQKAFGEGNAKYVYAGPVQNKTAAVSTWVPVASDAMAALALGVANVLISKGYSAPTSDFAAFKSLVMGKFSPAQVEKATGVKAGTVRKVAAGLMAAKKPVVVPGSAFGQGAGAAAFAAGFALNLLLNTKGMVALNEQPAVVNGAMSKAAIYSNDVVADFKAGKTPEVLFVYDANPAYGLPEAEAMAAALKKSFVVSFSTYMDETAEMADLILPAPHSFERYDDTLSPYGVGQVVYTVGAPVMNTGFETKSAPEFILELAKDLDADLGFDSFTEVLEAKADTLGATFDDLIEGTPVVKDDFASQNGLKLGAALLAQAAAYKGSGKVVVAPQFMLEIGSATVATPPLNLIAIPNTVLAYGNMYVEMNSATAKANGLVAGGRVRLTGAKGKCEALVKIDEGVMNGVVAAPLGLGRTAWDKFTKGKGDNVFKILTASSESGSGISVWSDSTVTIAKI